MRKIVGILVFISITYGILLGCTKKGNSDPGNGVIVTLDPEYIFTLGETYEITFDQKGLKSGDKIRFINTESKAETNVSIEIISDRKADIKLPGNFRSGNYDIYFFRAESLQNITLKKIGNVNIEIQPLKELDNKVVAHRGGAMETNLPDNSIASLKYAVSLGCYASECDIYITKDDKVVVCHSESGSDAVFGGKVIYNSTYDELKTKKLSNGETLPLLEDYIEEVAKSPFTKLWIDVKSIGDNNAANNNLSAQAGIKAAQIIKSMNAQSRVKFIVGRGDVLDQCIAAVQEEWDVAYMNTKYSPAQFVASGYDWANFEIDAFFNKPDLINEYKEKGIRVSVYNADSDAQMDFFLAEDMDAICTNYPEKLLSNIRK